MTLQLSKAPTPIFYSSYALEALPQLNGSVSYITSSLPLAAVSVTPVPIAYHTHTEADMLSSQVTPTRTVPLASMTPNFEVHPSPKRPLPPEEEYLAGDLIIPPADYLLYSRLHLPSLHLTALASRKFSPGLQGNLAFMYSPSVNLKNNPSSSSSSASGAGTSGGNANGTTASQPAQPAPSPPSPPGNLMLSLQHDKGRWATEYSYSAKDGMFGIRGLYNFGITEEMLRPVLAEETLNSVVLAATKKEVSKEVLEESWEGNLTGKGRIDQEDNLENGLKGRFSAGGEIYFSVKQRSLGGEPFAILLIDFTYILTYDPVA